MGTSYDPVNLTQEDLDDLATFYGSSREECRRRLLAYDVRELRDAWLRADPHTPAEIRAFYAGTDLYVWELMQWHASTARRQWTAARDLLSDHFPPAAWGRVLDYGCGVGTDALVLAQSGYDVCLADVPGVTFEFARHRFRRRGIDATYIAVTDDYPEVRGRYDILISIDVLEHLPDPVGVLRRLAAALRTGGIACIVAGFGDATGDRPCHLANNTERFGEERASAWHRAVQALGLESMWPMLPYTYRKAGGTRHMALRLRYGFWKRTGLWVCKVRQGKPVLRWGIRREIGDDLCQR